MVAKRGSAHFAQRSYADTKTDQVQPRPRHQTEQRAASVAEIARDEGMDVTQVRRLLRLTLLAPEVLERLTESPEAVLEHVMRRPWPNGWSDQMRVLAPHA